MIAILPGEQVGPDELLDEHDVLAATEVWPAGPKRNEKAKEKKN